MERKRKLPLIITHERVWIPPRWENGKAKKGKYIYVKRKDD
jgi:hypothetical protein